MVGQVQQEDEQAQLRAVAYGEVQGVGFRYWTRSEARGLGLTGYVRNRWGGADVKASVVEVVAEGQTISLQSLLNLLSRGPRAARVQRVSAEWRLYTGTFRSFEVRF